MRLIRLKLARKMSQTANRHDVINRFWLESNPKVNSICLKTQPYCKKCCGYGHSSRYCKARESIPGPLSDDDTLFQNLIVL